jgi:hypothetical protein
VRFALLNCGFGFFMFRGYHGNQLFTAVNSVKLIKFN